MFGWEIAKKVKNLRFFWRRNWVEKEKRVKEFFNEIKIKERKLLFSFLHKKFFLSSWKGFWIFKRRSFDVETESSIPMFSFLSFLESFFLCLGVKEF